MKKKLLITTLIITTLLLTATGILFMIKKENDTKKDLSERVVEEMQLEEEIQQTEKEDGKIYIKTDPVFVQEEEINKDIKVKKEGEIIDSVINEEIVKNTQNKTDMNGWKLVKDTNPGMDCSTQVYEGEVMIKGFPEYVENYGGQKQLLFRIVEEDLNKLPVINTNYPHIHIGNKKIAEFINFTKENPVKIKVIRHNSYCEGFGTIFIEE